MGKKIFRVLAVLAAAGIAAAGIYYFSRDGREQAGSLRLYGNVDIRESELAFEDNGRIEKIHVTEGDLVEQGQLLAEIDPVRYRAALARAGAKVKAQEHKLSRMLAGSRPEEIAAARARVDEAEAKLEEADRDYNRIKKLAESKFIPQQKLDSAEAALESAKAVLDAAKQELRLAVKGPRKEDIRAARAELEAYKSELELARQRLGDTKLYAPCRGVVRELIMEPGEMASPQAPVLSLARTSPLWVRAYVDETNLGRIAPGMRAVVRTDTYPGKRYTGWIGYISPTAEFTPKTVQTEKLRSKLVYQVRVYVCNPENELRLGMPATVTIPLDQPEPPPGRKSGSPCADDRKKEPPPGP